jgi:hypothetical protein
MTTEAALTDHPPTNNRLTWAAKLIAGAAAIGGVVVATLWWISPPKSVIVGICILVAGAAMSLSLFIVGARHVDEKNRALVGQLGGPIITALAALSAAYLAFDGIQTQLAIQQRAFEAAQVQASIAYADLLARRVLEVEAMLGRIPVLKRDAAFLAPEPPVHYVVDAEGRRRPFTAGEMADFKSQAINGVYRLQQTASLLPRTESVAAVIAIVDRLRRLPHLSGRNVYVYDGSLFNPDDELTVALNNLGGGAEREEANHKRILEDIDLLESKLSKEVTSLTERLRKIETTLH